MKLTLSIIKADVGSLGGHIKPSERLLRCVKGYLDDEFKSVIHHLFVSHTGDDIAILLTHTQGVNSAPIRRLAWDAFRAGTECAKEQGLYGAGQDLLKDSFSGNVKGMRPVVAEMEFGERPNDSRHAQLILPRSSTFSRSSTQL